MRAESGRSVPRIKDHIREDRQDAVVDQLQHVAAIVDHRFAIVVEQRNDLFGGAIDRLCGEGAQVAVPQHGADAVAPPRCSPPNQARDLLTRLPAEPSCQRPALRLPLADE